MGNKIKICAVTTISKTMDWFFVDSMHNLSKHGYEITLLCDMDEEFIGKNSDYARCVPMKMKRGANIGDLFRVTGKMRRFFKREKFDVLYYATPNAAMYASLAGKLAGIKIRVYNQCGLRYVSFSGLKRKIFKKVEKLTCSFSTHIRAQSPKNRQFAIDERLCPPGKISVVGIGGTTGVDLSECRKVDAVCARAELRQKYGIPTDAFVYGFVGRINRDKGVNELIEAFKTVSEIHDNTFIVLVGMIDDANPITEENMSFARACERIVMTGNVPKESVYAYMSMFDVLVHPTYREGFGKVLQEAMGMKLPILTTNVPGPSEVVEDGISGILCRVKDSADLAEKMLLLYENVSLRDSIANAGLIRAEKYFDRPIMLNNILLDMDEITHRRNDNVFQCDNSGI